MANAILNGDFERGLHQWEVLPEYWADLSNALIGTQEATAAPKGQSLFIELARWVQVEQAYPWMVFANESHLHFSFMGDAADFYTIIHYEDNTTTSVHFYGHWPRTWVSEQVPVLTDKGIVRLEFLFVGAMNFYLDNISLEGSSLPPSRFVAPRIQEIPEELYEYDLRFSNSPLMGRLAGIECELKTITALLAQQQYPEVIKDIDTALANRVPKVPSAYRNN